MNTKQLCEIADAVREESERKQCDVIVSALPLQMEMMAKRGMTSMAVMEVPDTEYAAGFFGLKLSGTSKKVFDACKKAGWRPRVVEYGYSDGFHRIVISWC